MPFVNDVRNPIRPGGPNRLIGPSNSNLFGLNDDMDFIQSPNRGLGEPIFQALSEGSMLDNGGGAFLDDKSDH